MWIISKRPLRNFWTIHPDARSPLKHGIKMDEEASWTCLADVRQDFPVADQVGILMIFDVGGSKYRLVVRMRFD